MPAMTSPSFRRQVLRVAVVGLVPLLAGSLVATPASAATLVGSTFTPNAECAGAFVATFVQSPTPAYAVPTAGVVTAWRFAASITPPRMKFKVLRPSGGSTFTVIGSSDEVKPVASTTSTFPVRIPVLAGDLLGMSVLSPGGCATLSGGTFQYVQGDAPTGSPLVYSSATGTLDIAANVEPDADGDGYGDETQDGCPSQASSHGACDTTAPDSRFTSGPTRTFKSKVTFRFTSDDPGAGFECRLTGKRVKQIAVKTFQPCTSPKTYKRLKPGAYTVSVRGVDVAGNVEATPATSKLKVKPKPR
jgi:hypothetical protein